MNENTKFPNPTFIDLKESASISPNSWAPLKYDMDGDKITKYRLLSVVEGAECDFHHNDESVVISFKKGSLLTLDVNNQVYTISYFPEDTISHSKETSIGSNKKITEYF